MSENGQSDGEVICLAHAAYRLGDEFARRGPGHQFTEVRDLDGVRAALETATVIVASGLWRNEFAALAPRLRFVQSTSAGTDQFSREALAARGIRLASAQGGNERAVAEHAMALILSLTRQLGPARDDQHAHRWRGMIGDPALREDELSGKTMLIVGLGRIGTRLARLARAFDMRVVGLRRSPRRDTDIADEIVPPDRLLDALASADIVALTCPLTPDTENLLRAEHFRAMKRSAYLVNVARGRVVDEPALAAALGDGLIAGAGLDCFHEEPLPATSPFWDMANVVVTPHSAGETKRYEASVIDILVENLVRLRRGETLLNQIV